MMIKEKIVRVYVSRRLYIYLISDSLVPMLYNDRHDSELHNYLKEDCMILFFFLLRNLSRLIERRHSSCFLSFASHLSSRFFFFFSRWMNVQGDVCIGVQHMHIRRGIHLCPCAVTWCSYILM